MTDALNICLTRIALDVGAATQAAACPEAGGIAVFLGTTRAEAAPLAESTTGDARSDQLLALDYHAYDEMALAEMRKIAQETLGRWPVHRLVVWHRLGEVRVGEASVIIAASCPHRGEAFTACQFVIDELKKRVPIWKKELYGCQQRWQGA